MIKVMHLDMFCFEYKPIFSEHEKVIFTNNQVIVSFKDNKKSLEKSSILGIKLDTLFAQRVGQNWTNDQIINALKSMDSNNKTEKDKYRLLVTEPEDEISVSYDFMIDTLRKLNYDDQSFEYIAYGD